MGYVWVEEKEDDKKFKKHLTKKITEATITITNTNKGLLADIGKLKKANKKKEGIEVDEFNRLQIENAQLKTQQQEGETEAEKQLRLAREQHSDEVKALKKRLDKKDKKDEKNLIKSEIAEAIVKINVKSSMANGAKHIMNSDITMEEGIPMIGDKTVLEFAEDWAKTEEGKHYVLAPKNGGGNSTGGDNAEAEVEQAKFFDKKSGSLNITKQVLLKKSNSVLYKKLKEKYKN